MLCRITMRITMKSVFVIYDNEKQLFFLCGMGRARSGVVLSLVITLFRHFRQFYRHFRQKIISSL